MKKITSVIIALTFLAACATNEQDSEAIKAQAKADAAVVQDKAEKSAMRVANIMRDNTKSTAAKMREWWLTPLPEPPARPGVPNRYCYQVLQDITCYRQAIPGKTHQLVGYQGTNAPQPPVAQTTVMIRGEDTAKIVGVPGEVEKIKGTTPVFVKPPTAVKEDKSNSAVDEAAVLGNEPLPNPLLSPQL